MKTCSAYQRERCVAAEMEACWVPASSKASLPVYKPESDPFCPLVRPASNVYDTLVLCKTQREFLSMCSGI